MSKLSFLRYPRCVYSHGSCGFRLNITGKKLIPLTPQCFQRKKNNDVKNSLCLPLFSGALGRWGHGMLKTGELLNRDWLSFSSFSRCGFLKGEGKKV